MLHFTRGAAASFHLTLSELVTLTAPQFLFVFDSRTPGHRVALVLSPEVSDTRRDEFALDVEQHFAGLPLGQYTYRVYEQNSIDNIDPAQSGALVEHGIMHLHPATPFAFVQPSPVTAYTQPA